MKMGIPVTYDAEGRPVMPRFAPNNPTTTREAAKPNYLRYTPNVADDLVSCICMSKTFYHLRWAYYDDDPADDEGKTICGRKRSKDEPGFWTQESGRCDDCISGLNNAALDIGEDCGWFTSVEGAMPGGGDSGREADG